MTEPGVRQRTVLVTRPKPQSYQLSDAIRAAGGEAIELPMLAIKVYPENQAIKDKILNLDYYDIIITVSTTAAKAGLALIDTYWPQVPAHIKWLAVGAASKQILLDYGLDAKAPEGSENSESLLQMPALKNVTGLRILIMKGKDGRPVLAETLVAAGANVDSMDLYERAKPQYSDDELQGIMAHKPDVVTATSIAILENLEAIVSPVLPGLEALPLIVASERIADRAEQLGFKQVVIAAGASDDALLSALNSLSK